MSSMHGWRRQSEQGVALLISIFALMLISGIAVSLIIMAGNETAINANYRRTTMVFYGAHAGIEEARERMVPCSPNTLWPNTACQTPPVSNDPMFQDNPATVLGQTRYIVNPSLTDPAYNPMTGPAQYLDTEYQSEFGVPAIASGGTLVPTSGMSQLFGLPAMTYKWVRITLKSESMGGVDLDGDGDTNNSITPVRLDSQGRQCIPPVPGCVFDPNAPVTSKPVYRITALAVEPTGSRRLVQAEVTALPVINPSGAISSQAGVTINGNFNAFGAWPPIVNGSCGSGKAKTNKDTCGQFQGGAVQPDCANLYDAPTDTCNGVPRSHNDFCNQAAAANGVSSAGNIASGNYDKVPDSGNSCKTTGVGCISTVSPQKALDANMPNWPYDMNQIIQAFQPPVTSPIQTVPGISCGAFDAQGNRNCNGQGVAIGTLPTPWPPLPNTIPTNNTPALVFADVGQGGLLKLTGASSGSGILVVEGDLEVQAGFQWYGLLVVRGVVTFLGGGATGTNVVGGILAGTSVTNASTTTGGSVSVTYSSCAFRYNNNTMPLRYLSFREIAQ